MRWSRWLPKLRLVPKSQLLSERVRTSLSQRAKTNNPSRKTDTSEKTVVQGGLNDQMCGFCDWIFHIQILDIVLPRCNC